MNTISRLLAATFLAFIASGMAFSAQDLASSNDPGFDILNKTGNTVYIRLINGDNAPIRHAAVEPAKMFLGSTVVTNNKSAQIDLKEPTILIVWDKKIRDPNDIISTKLGSKGEGTSQYLANWNIAPAPAFLYHFKPGKSIYVTLDPGGGLRPQSGRFLTGKTEAGYPKTNILEPSDIIRYGQKAKQ